MIDIAYPPLPRRARRHGLATRLAHAGLGIAVIVQLATSLRAEAPEAGRPGNAFMGVHEIAGLVALAFVVGFWMVAMTRLRGAPPGRMFPWFSRERLRALRDDLEYIWRWARRGRIVPFTEEAPLPAAVHGLGLLLMTWMAATGAVWLAAGAVGFGDSGAALALSCHRFAGNLVWAYLIGHAGMALLHHVRGEVSLGEIWSLAR